MAAKTKPKASKAGANGTPPNPEGVLTLAEAAKLLRVSEAGLLADVIDGRVPCRLVAGEWRFTKEAIFEWLRQPEVNVEAKKSMLSVIGAFKDDDTLEPMVEEIYRRRREKPLR